MRCSPYSICHRGAGLRPLPRLDMIGDVALILAPQANTDADLHIVVETTKVSGRARFPFGGRGPGAYEGGIGTPEAP